MSRIYEALRRAQQERSRARQAERAGEASAQEQPSAGEAPENERRRSARLALRIPLFVYGHSVARQPFHEETQSLRVNENGGLLTLATQVRRGQKLLLTNKATQSELECRVVWVGLAPSQPPAREGRRPPARLEVGVEFLRPASHFWHLAPEEEPRRRK
jgi:hypothetical protein